MNVILLSLESTRSDYFGPGAEPETPTVDTICREGDHFPETFVHLPHTANHGSILTGKLPRNTGIRTLGGALESDEIPTAFTIFSHNGFETRTLLGSGMLKDRGFEEWGYWGSDSLENVEQVIRQNSGEDFFLFIHYWNTHMPYRTKLPVRNPLDLLANLMLDVQEKAFGRGYMGRYGRPRWTEIIRYPVKYFWRYRLERLRDLVREDPDILREGYKRSLEDADDYISNIIEFLKSEDIEDETLLVVTGDHGESFDEHGERNETRKYEHGPFLYDNAVKVPLVFWTGKDGMLEGGTHEKLARSIDILPTVTGLLDLENDADFDGIDLIEYTPEYAYAETHENTEKAMLRTDKYKLIRDFEKGEDEFYDLKENPKETNNIAEERESFIEEKLSVLRDFMGDFGRSKEEDKIKSRLRDLGYRD